MSREGFKDIKRHLQRPVSGAVTEVACNDLSCLSMKRYMLGKIHQPISFIPRKKVWIFSDFYSSAVQFYQASVTKVLKNN